MSELSLPTAEELSGPERARWIERYMKSFHTVSWYIIALHTRTEKELFTRHVREWVNGDRQGIPPTFDFDQLHERNDRRWSERSKLERFAVSGCAYVDVQVDNFDFNFPLPRVITEFTPSR